MVNAYTTPKQFIKSTTGTETTSLIGNSGFLTGAHVQGSMALTLYQGLDVQLQKYDSVTIFDGSSTEQVIAGATMAPGQSTITLLNATSFAHSDGTEYCTDGPLGSLSDQILRASQILETICKQALFTATYTNEELSMPTMRASIDNAYNLHFRPRHWPIQNIASLAIATLPGVFTQYDTTQIFVDSDKQICKMPNLQALTPFGSGQSPYVYRTTQNRTTEAEVTITYTAGYNTPPFDIVEAAVLLSTDILSKRQNPIGAPDISSGGRHVSAVLRGDNTGESLLYKRAKKILDNYTVESF